MFKYDKINHRIKIKLRHMYLNYDLFKFLKKRLSLSEGNAVFIAIKIH